MGNFRLSMVSYIRIGVLVFLMLVMDYKNGDAENILMILVAEGKFTMGVSSEEQEEVLKFGWSAAVSDRIQALVQSAGPPHTVHLNAFFIDKYEATNRQYRAFVEATGYRLPSFWSSRPQFSHPDQPVVGVSWADAKAFCTWAGKRLPTEAEWEKAARGRQGLAYPWGNEWDPTKLRSADSVAGLSLDTFAAWFRWHQESRKVTSESRPAPVGSYPMGASPYGVMDMAGNVWEWVADWYDPQYYSQSPGQNPMGPPEGVVRVLRGGAWDVPRAVTLTWFRENIFPPEFRRSSVTGFRCAKTAGSMHLPGLNTAGLNGVKDISIPHKRP